MQIQNSQLRELFKTPQRKTYTLAGMTVIVVGLFIALTIRPTFLKIADLNKEIADKREFLEDLEVKTKTLTTLITKKQENTEELLHFEKALPEEIKSGYIVANLSAIADDYDLILRNVEFKETDTDEELYPDIDNITYLATTEVNLTLEGELNGIEKYLEYLESFPRTFDVQSINYERTELSEFSDNLEEYKPIKCSIHSFVFFWEGENLEEE